MDPEINSSGQLFNLCTSFIHIRESLEHSFSKSMENQAQCDGRLLDARKGQFTEICLEKDTVPGGMQRFENVAATPRPC